MVSASCADDDDGDADEEDEAEKLAPCRELVLVEVRGRRIALIALKRQGEPLIRQGGARRHARPSSLSPRPQPVAGVGDDDGDGYGGVDGRVDGGVDGGVDGDGRGGGDGGVDGDGDGDGDGNPFRRRHVQAWSTEREWHSAEAAPAP